MPTMTNTDFDQLQTTLQQEGIPAMLDRLADRLREEKKYHELFDARLLAGRHRLGLPVILTSTLDELPEPQRTQVEDSYLDACREVGNLLLADGRVREAWMYLRPIGDREAVAAALEKIEPDDERLEQLIEVALHEGVHPELGFRLVLEHYGTCNAITMFDGMMHERPRSQQQGVVRLLVRHLHNELSANIRADIERREGAGKAPPAASLEELLTARPELVADDNYHIDTSHLGATVRFARLAEDAETLRLALDLTEYGRRLSPQYQYPAEEPFRDAFTAHGHFFRAQLGEGVDEALAYFRDKAEALPLAEHGPGPAETYIALLARLKRYEEAIDASLSLLPPGTATSRFAPSLLELSCLAGQYERLLATSRERGDLLGFAAGLVQATVDGKA